MKTEKKQQNEPSEPQGPSGPISTRDSILTYLISCACFDFCERMLNATPVIHSAPSLFLEMHVHRDKIEIAQEIAQMQFQETMLLNMLTAQVRLAIPRAKSTEVRLNDTRDRLEFLFAKLEKMIGNPDDVVSTPINQANNEYNDSEIGDACCPEEA